MRFVSPILFAAAAAYVAWYNGSHEGQVLMLPFMEVLSPATMGDPAAQGALSVNVLAGFAVLFAVLDLVQWLRARRQAEDE